MKIFIIMIVFLFSHFAFAETNIDDRYYLQLNDDERDELQTIKRNYHRYSSQLKQIANRRASEIKIKMLPIEKQIALYDDIINSIISDSDGMPDNIRNIIMHRQQQYVRLPMEIQKELIKFNMKLITKDELSETARDYLAGKNLLVNDNDTTK